ncbi:hypothetical protein ISN44_As05g000510 [Arabidopsis suecica]|uniref:Uncharacterized protein n=1 Tax=Arabidopsis suecica TaxID=45249 RepID=A0A8T2D8E9_ARASU|nr:hypothetical protein ISN44_As05g000510 [Arabidopsis suecica]
MGRIYAHHAYRASFCSQIHICVSRLQVRSYTTNPRFARRYDFEEKLSPDVTESQEKLLSPDVSDSSTSVAKQFQSSAKMRFLHKHKAFKMKKKKKKMLVKPPSPKKNLQCFIKT